MPRITAVGFAADADSTGNQALAYIGDISFAPR
jgi:hypothetical protein